MVFLSFDHVAQFWLPEPVRVQVKRQKGLIWCECGPNSSLVIRRLL